MVVSQYVGVIFYGVVDGKNFDVLLVGEGLGIVSGIGIVLFDSQGQQFLFNCLMDCWILFYCGWMMLNFVVKYWVIGCQVIGGVVNVQVWFLLIYQ